MKPTQILTKLCKDSKIEVPLYMNGTVRVGRKLFRIQSSDNNEEWYRVKGKYIFSHFSKIIKLWKKKTKSCIDKQ